ncbi:MAG TPA: ABC transporter ATP-binding protein/permease [Candidatus Anaerobutyricum faecale]|nr:ABC transporter ATP-binding protein/permease [Candidatus Anaerobutyricum faecale]
METKKTMTQKETAVRLWNYLKPHSFFVILSLVMAAVTVAGTLYLPILMGDAIDCIIGKGQVDFAAIRRILLFGVAAAIVTGVAQWIMNICNNRITFHVTRDIRNRAIEKIEILPLKYVDGHSYGDVVSRVIADVDQFADGLLMGFTQFFTGVITILGTLGFMFSIHPWIALLVVCLTPISLFVARFIASHTYSMFRLQSETRGQETALVEEMVEGQKVVKAFAYENTAQERFDEINGRLQDCSLQATFYSSLTNPCTRFVNSLVYASVALSGALTALSGGLSVGQLTVLLSYANQYTKPFNEISGVVTELQNAFACAARIFELIDETPQTPDPEDAEILSDVEGNVTLSHVKFSYQPGKKLIEDFNLQVSQGQRVAIVGPTGCGKTTIINLLMRFYDVNDGSIQVDGTDIRHITRESLRSSYGMVLQDTWLKTGTVRENITLGNEGYTDEQIIQAAKEAHSYSFIKKMPKGLDTWITEDGAGMSQGQKQLLCITRVMLHVPAMLILDEATSSIDTRTEQKIQNAFAKLMEGRTSFIVAHRLSTIQNADIILVMKDGRIIEQGNHEDLLARNGFYAQLYNSQFASV